MKYAILGFLFFSVQAFASTCQLTDVKIEGSSAISCVGMIDGNVNSLEDVNSILGESYTDYSDLTTSENIFSFADVYSGIIEIALKQNTLWAIYRFDLSLLDNVDGVWNGTWSTSGMNWDGQALVRGCQGCGGLSHAALIGDLNEVPLPGTLGLLGIGLVGLGMIRKTVR